MDKWEYIILSNLNDINRQGKQGWRVVPGVGERDKIMMERKLEEK